MKTFEDTNMTSQVLPTVNSEITSQNHKYILPASRDTVFSVFSSVKELFWKLSGLAKSDTRETAQHRFIQTERRISDIFKYVNQETGATNITQSQILDDFNTPPFPERTITIFAAEDHVKLSYKDGFYATEEALTIPYYSSEDFFGNLLYYCGSGIKSVYAPFEPSWMHKWRYRKERTFQVSLKTVTDSESLRVGILTLPPVPPLWYPLVSTLSYNPVFAKPTFEVANQSPVVKELLKTND